jgi:hypothetical protein
MKKIHRHRIAGVLMGIAVATPAVVGAQAGSVAAAGLELLVGQWEARDARTVARLSYSWEIPGRMLVEHRRITGDDGALVAEYAGAHMLNPETGEWRFHLATGGGELHIGKTEWRGGLLWFDARVLGGDKGGHASVVDPRSDTLLSYSRYSEVPADSSLLRTTPLVYSRLPRVTAVGERFIVLLKLRHDLWARYAETGVWPNDTAANALLRGHVSYWATQFKDGKVTLTGGMGGEYWDNVAEIILRVADREEAERIVNGDPAIRGHVFKAQIRPFTVHMLLREEVP